MPRYQPTNPEPSFSPESNSSSDSDNFEQQQLAKLQKFETYLTSIAMQEMKAGLERKFGVSDVVQQTYCAAIHRIENFRGTSEAEFRGWLRQILLNQMRQNERELLRAKRDFRLEQSIDSESAGNQAIQEPTDRWPTPCTAAATTEEDRRLHLGLMRLSKDHREVIKLRNWERLSFKEIGKQMDRSVKATEQLWYRAILKLQQELGSIDD